MKNLRPSDLWPSMQDRRKTFSIHEKSRFPLIWARVLSRAVVLEAFFCKTFQYESTAEEAVVNGCLNERGRILSRHTVQKVREIGQTIIAMIRLTCCLQLEYAAMEKNRPNRCQQLDGTLLWDDSELNCQLNPCDGNRSSQFLCTVPNVVAFYKSPAKALDVTNGLKISSMTKLKTQLGQLNLLRRLDVQA